MEALPGPLFADAPSDVDLRRVWATIARSAWLILGCVLLALAAGVVAVRRLEPVYEATASIRIDARGANNPAAMLYGLTTDNQNLIATATEVLTSRSLANDVSDSLGLRVQLEEPRRTARRQVILSARVDTNAKVARYRLSPVSGGRVTVREALSNRTVGTYAMNAPITLSGVVLRLSPEAFSQGEAVIRVTTPEAAAEIVRASTRVAQPNINANILTVTYQGNDPLLVRDVSNLLAARFVRRRLEAEKAGARSTVALLQRQLDTLGAEMRTRETAVSSFLQSNKIISVENESQQRTTEIGRLTELRIAAITDLSSIRASLQNLVNARDTTDQRVAFERIYSVPALMRTEGNSFNPGAAFRERLRKFEDTRDELVKRVRPTDPDVKAIDRQIAMTKRDLRSTITTFANGLEQQVRAYDERIGQLRSAVQQLPAQAVEYQRLDRNQKGVERIMLDVQGRLKEAEIAAAVQDSTSEVLDRAVLPMTSLGTSRPVIFAVALFSGLIVGMAVAFLRDWLDTTVHNEQDLMQIAHAPVIGIIPNLHHDALTSRYRSLVAGEFPALGLPAGKATREGESQTMAAEAYRALRTNLSYVSPAKPPRVIVLTSALSGDGKTTSAANLAVTLAQQNKRVLLIDAETRRGNLHTLFGIEAQPGFFDLLYGQATPGECIRRVALEGTGHLDVLPSGGAPNANAADLLVAGRLAPFFERLRQQYDYVLIDTPPLNLFTDAALIGAHADATLLVARADRTERQALRFAVLQLQHVQANLAGAILNGVDLRRNSRYRGGYDFGRYGAYYS